MFSGIKLGRLPIAIIYMEPLVFHIRRKISASKQTRPACEIDSRSTHGDTVNPWSIRPGFHTLIEASLGKASRTYAMRGLVSW